MPIILGIRHAQDNTPMNLTDFCKRSLFWVLFILALSGPLYAEETEARRILSKLILANSEEQQAVAEELYDHGDQIIKEVIEGWRMGEVSVFDQDGNPIALLKRGEDSYEEISSGNSFSGGTA